jgi:hypothetical protein
MENNINSAWAAIVPILKNFKFYTIKEIVGLAGFDIKKLDDLGIDNNNYNKPNGQQLVSEIGGYFSRFHEQKKQQFLNIVIEEVLNREHEFYGNYSIEEKLQYYLNRLGWQLIDNKVLPIEILYSSDLDELDSSAREDLIKAATKFRDGDLSGAISSACAAVDSVTAKIYQKADLKISDANAFQEKCNVSFREVGIFTDIETQLNELGWEENKVKQLNENLKKSLKQAAFVMQVLRSGMSDAHGTKPVLKPLVFDSIKWSQIIIRLLSERNN